MQESFIESLSKPQPIPGGGAAAAYGAMVGLGLLEKIVRVEMQRESLTAEMKPFWGSLLDSVSSHTHKLATLRDEDGKAYLRMAETKTSAGSAEEMQAALGDATEVPMRILKEAFEALSSTHWAAQFCKKHLLSDLQVVGQLIYAGGAGAGHIAHANLRLATDVSFRNDCRARLSAMVEDLRQSLERLHEIVSARLAVNR